MSDEAYSRVTDAAKWRILAARTDAWGPNGMQPASDAAVTMAAAVRDINMIWVGRPRAGATAASLAARSENMGCP